MITCFNEDATILFMTSPIMSCREIFTYRIICAVKVGIIIELVHFATTINWNAQLRELTYAVAFH